MAGFSTYLSNKVLDHVNGVATYTPPSTMYVALFSTASSLAEIDAGTLTNEIAGTGYARQSISLGAATASAAENNSAITFTATAANWSTVRFAAIMDAATAGNVLYYGQLGADRSPGDGESVTIAVGDFDVSLDA